MQVTSKAGGILHMKGKISFYLKTFAGCVFGVFLGNCIYRFYDFNRHNTNRSLDLEKCYETVNIPEIDLPKPFTPIPVCKDGIELYEYYDKPKEYTAKRIKVNGEGEYENPLFMFYACVDGEGEISGTSIKAGECVFVPCNSGPVEFNGKMDLILLSYRG